jgi:small subunit ribosomal protein S17
MDMAEEEDTTTEDAPTEPVAPDADPVEPVAEESADEAVAAADGLAPRERRARDRAAKAEKAKARGPVTAEERHAERQVRRAAKATERRAGRAKATAKAKASAHESQPTPPREHVAGNQKVRQGVVTSDKADKTITVRIDVARRHRKYQKIVRTSQTLHAHDESNDAHTGDTVTVREARPLSRTKRWRLVGVVERAK